MADRKEEIIRASIKIFAAKGYYNTHIADIVGEVGIAKGTFYLYFNSKKDLFVSLINRFDQIFLHAFDTKSFAVTDKNIQSFFYRLLKSLFMLYQKHEDLSIIISREAVTVNKEFSQKFKEMDQKRFERLRVLFDFFEG